MVLRRARHGRRLGIDAADDRLLRRDPAGGHRRLRAGTEGIAFPLIQPRSLLSASRERRAPLPVAGDGIPGTRLDRQVPEGFGAPIGSVKRKSDPEPTVVSNHMRPPCISTTCFAIARPSPVPMILSLVS